MNIWLVAVAVVTPLTVFTLSVKRSAITHIGVILFAVLATYLALNLALLESRAADRRAYDACAQGTELAPDILQFHEMCGHHINTEDGAQNVFTLLFGWVPALTYAGLWEAAWRIRHRRKLRTMGARYQGRWFSNVVIALALPPTLLFVWMIVGAFH
ncbi:MAG: hypothetical protein AAF590_10590 [Pseudomonadota bacterium]